MRKNTILIVFLLLMSCNRDSISLSKNSKEINNARIWLDSYLKNNSVNPIFKNINYHWNKASNFKFKNGYSAITIPITEINQNPGYTGKRILYLYPWKNGKGYYSSIFEILPDELHLNKYSGKIDLNNFSGSIVSWDIVNGFSKGIKYQDGIGVGNIKLQLLDSRNNQSTNKTTSLITNSGSSSVTVIGYIPAARWNTFWISLLTSIGYNIFDLWGSSGGNPCEYTGCGVNDNISDYIDPNSFVDPENNDDMDGKAEIKNITDDIQNPCLKNTLDQVTAMDLENSITDILYNVFGNSADFNINFHDGDLNNNLKDGITTPVIWSSGRMDFSITLNTGTLPQASKEFTATTIYHEILHAYLRTTGAIGQLNQHNNIANEYTEKLALALHTIFPNLSEFDRKALSWGGLEGTNAYDSIMQNHPDHFKELQRTNSYYRTKTLGTPCN